jgi:hypothetical protein
MLKYMGIFLFAILITSCEEEPFVLEEQSVCINELYTPTNQEYKVHTIEEFITNDCQPSLPLVGEYDYLYKIYEDADTLFVYTNKYWGNQEHLDNTQIWSSFTDTDLIYNPN